MSGGLSDFLKAFDNKTDDGAEQEPKDPVSIEKHPAPKIKTRIKLNIKNHKNEAAKAPSDHVESKSSNSVTERASSIQGTYVHETSVTDIERMFIESETDPEFKEDWLEMYERARRSRKKTSTVRKILNGRFRIMDGGRMDILSELKTHDMSSSDMLNTKWLE